MTFCAFEALTLFPGSKLRDDDCFRKNLVVAQGHFVIVSSALGTEDEQRDKQAEKRIKSFEQETFVQFVIIITKSNSQFSSADWLSNRIHKLNFPRNSTP